MCSSSQLWTVESLDLTCMIYTLFRAIQINKTIVKNKMYTEGLSEGYYCCDETKTTYKRKLLISSHLTVLDILSLIIIAENMVAGTQS